MILYYVMTHESHQEVDSRPNITEVLVNAVIGAWVSCSADGSFNLFSHYYTIFRQG